MYVGSHAQIVQCQITSTNHHFDNYSNALIRIIILLIARRQYNCNCMRIIIICVIKQKIYLMRSFPEFKCFKRPGNLESKIKISSLTS